MKFVDWFNIFLAVLLIGVLCSGAFRKYWFLKRK